MRLLIITFFLICSLGCSNSDSSISVNIDQDAFITIFTSQGSIIKETDNSWKVLTKEMNNFTDIQVSKTDADNIMSLCREILQSTDLKTENIGGPGYDITSITFGQYRAISINIGSNTSKGVEFPANVIKLRSIIFKYFPK